MCSKASSDSFHQGRRALRAWEAEIPHGNVRAKSAGDIFVKNVHQMRITSPAVCLVVIQIVEFGRIVP